MSLDEYFSIGASALKADLRFATTDSSLGFCSKGSRTSVENTDRFLLVDYLPVPVIKYVILNVNTPYYLCLHLRCASSKRFGNTDQGELIRFLLFI